MHKGFTTIRHSGFFGYFSVVIYHVTTEKEWAIFLARQEYAPAAYEKEGFIHTCALHQLEGVLSRYFKGREDLILLYIDETMLVHELKYEAATGGELFPHIYGTINKTSIVKIIYGRSQFPSAKMP
jgi:uncharacterized protein (DUF952 family)